MYSILNRHVLYPLYFTLKKDARLKRLKEITKNQWLSKDEIIEKQFRNVLTMFQYAYKNVPYYRRRYSAQNIDLTDIKTREDFAKLPVLNKKDLQNNLKQLLSEACSTEDLYEDSSGGSTGKPTIFFGDRRNVHKKYAANILTDTWTGWQIGERSVYLWGADREINKLRVFKEKILQKYILRQDTLNAFSMSEKRMEFFARQLQKQQPSLIVAYSNAAFLFAKFLKKNGISGISPKGIVCSAETLTEEKRKIIEEVFQCKVLNRYGSREVGLIAAECPYQQGLHINANDVYVEFVHIGDGKQFEIIVTDLNNYVMPFIRYNMGDMAQQKESMQCECGRGLPLIEKVHGRSSDFILHPDGRLIHGEFFSHAFYGMEKIKQFQIIQNTLDNIDINIVATDILSSDEKGEISRKVYSELGSNINIHIKETDNIPTPPSGKFRFAISKVAKKD